MGVYEQHTRQLQVQVRSADFKAMDLHSTLQQNVDFLRQEDGAKQQLREETDRMKAQLANAQDDHALTRKTTTPSWACSRSTSALCLPCTLVFFSPVPYSRVATPPI